MYDTNNWSGDTKAELNIASVSLAAEIIVVRSGMNESPWHVTAHGAKRQCVREWGGQRSPSVGTNHSARAGQHGTAIASAAGMTGEPVLPRRTLSASALATSEAVRVARSGKKPAASGVNGSSGGGMAGACGDDAMESEDSGFGSDDGFLVIEPRQAEFTLEERFGSWKEKAEKHLARMQACIGKLFKYSSAVSFSCVSDIGSCATIRLEEKTILQLPRPKKMMDRITLHSIITLLRTALETGNPKLDAQIVVYEGWTGSVVILITASHAVLSSLFLRIRTPQGILLDDGKVQLTVTELAPVFFWKIMDIDYSLAMQDLLNRRLFARKRDVGVPGRDVGGAWFEIKHKPASLTQQGRGILVLAKSRVTAQRKALPDLSGVVDVHHKFDTVSLVPSGCIRGASGGGSSSAVPIRHDTLQLPAQVRVVSSCFNLVASRAWFAFKDRAHGWLSGAFRV
jgi:hypothetical protein